MLKQGSHLQSSLAKMVRRQNFNTSRENWQPSPQQQHFQDDEYALAMRPSQVHDRPLTVAQALRDHAGVPVKAFALVAILDNGQERVYSSHKNASIDPNAIFQQLRSEPVKCETGQTSSSAAATEYGWWGVNTYGEDGAINPRRCSVEQKSRHKQRQPKSEDSDDDDDSLSSSRRKRSRPSATIRSKSTNAPIPTVSSSKMKTIRIGDSNEVFKFYIQSFRDLQQTACKSIGKVFVKAVEPKKQTHHPYVKGEEKTPPWWPSGTDFVRHKEPDHLLKQERIKLLVWILRLVVKPNAQQHEAIRHLGLTVKKLEDLTTEKLSEFFGDPAHPSNAGKRRYLKELFKVARQEERYLDGGIDADTHCNIMFGSRTRVEDDDASTDEDDQFSEHDEEFSKADPSIAATSNTDLASQHMESPRSEVRPPELFQNADNRSHVLGYNGHPQSENSSFSDSSVFGRGMAIGFQSPLSGETDHRTFGSPVYQQSQSPFSWTTSTPTIVSTTTMVSPFYASPPTLPGPSNPPFHLSQMPPMTQIPPLLPPLNPQTVYDSQPRYDLNAGMVQQLRPGNFSHPHMPHHSTGYGEYHEANGLANNESEYKDSHLHHPEH